MKQPIYLAGPIAGLPDYNYPAFNAAAAKLRAMGHTVLNPAENHAPPCGTWQAYMRQAITQLVQCQSIVLLQGWADSKGAGLEFDIAMRLGLAMHRFEELDAA